MKHLVDGRSGAVSLALFFAAVLLLRIVALGTEGLWVDEGYTYLLTLESPGRIVESLRNDDAPPLFYLVQKFFNDLPRTVGLEPSPETSARLLPALASALAVFVLALARPPARGGWPALLLMGLSSYAIFYGRQGRSYGWILLWVVVVLLSARRLAVGKGWGSAVLLAFALGVLLWSHNLGLLLWASGLLAFAFFFVRARRREEHTGRWIRGLAAHAAGIVLCLPWHLFGGNQLAYHAFSNRWIADYWKEVPVAFAPALSLVVYGPGSPVRPYAPVNLPQAMDDETWILCLAATLALLLLALVGLIRSVRSRRLERGSSWEDMPLEAVYLFGPLLLALGASVVWAPTYVLGRTDVIAFPAFAMLAGRGLFHLGRKVRWATLALCSIISLALVLPLVGVGTSARLKQRDRNLAHALAGELRPGDLVIYTALTAPSLESYFHAWGTAHETSFYPPSQALNPAASPFFALDSLDVFREAALELRRRLEGGEVHRLLPLVRLRSGIPHSGSKTAEDLIYPQSVLAFLLGGLDPLPILVREDGAGRDSLRYRQDWVGGNRMVLAYTREHLVDLSLLGDIEVRP